MGGISVLIVMGILSFIFLTFMAIFFAIVIYKIVAYIFESASIMCMCKNLKYKASFTAWIPFYNKYLLGKIADNKILGAIFALLSVVNVGMSMYCYSQKEFNTSSLIFLACVLFECIIYIVISHKLYKKAINKYADILTILSVISCGLLIPIFYFLIRNKIKSIDNYENIGDKEL